MVQNLNVLSMLRRPVDENEAMARNRMIQHRQVREVTVATDPPEAIIGDDEI